MSAEGNFESFLKSFVDALNSVCDALSKLRDEIAVLVEPPHTTSTGLSGSRLKAPAGLMKEPRTWTTRISRRSCAMFKRMAAK